MRHRWKKHLDAPVRTTTRYPVMPPMVRWLGGWDPASCEDLVFLHGTAIMHATAAGQPRAQRVRQSRELGPAVLDFGAYIPARGAATKVHAWQRRGAQICYLSSHQHPAGVELDHAVLSRWGFPAATVFWRQPGESYTSAAHRAQADVVVEDDCASTGGGRQTTAASVAARPGCDVTCVVVPEFGGLAHLPDDPA